MSLGTRPQPAARLGLGSQCLEKQWFWMGTGPGTASWAGMAILSVEGSQVVVMTQPRWEPQSMGFDLCRRMTGQAIGLRAATVPYMSQTELRFLTGGQLQLRGSAMEAETSSELEAAADSDPRETASPELGTRAGTGIAAESGGSI